MMPTLNHLLEQGMPALIKSIFCRLDPGYGRDVWLLTLAMTLGYGAFLGLRDLLSPLLWLRLGYGPEIVGNLFATGALSYCAFSLPAGALGTRLGARRTMLLGLFISAAGQALLPFAGSIPAAWRTACLFTSQATSTAGWSLFTVNAVTTMANVTTARNRRGAYAMIEVGSGVGMLVGALLGGLLPGLLAHVLRATTDMPRPYSLGLWAGVATFLVMLVPVSLVRPPEQSARAAQARAPWRVERWLVLLMLSALTLMATSASCRAFIAAYMDTELGLATSLVGTVTSVAMGASIVASFSSSRVARRLGNARVMFLSTAGMALSLALIALTRQWVLVGLGVVGALGLQGLWKPVFQALQMEIAPPEGRAMVSGATAMGMSLGFGSMSFGGGRIVTAVGYRSVFAVGAGLALASALVSLALRRYDPSDQATTPEASSHAEF